MKKILLDTDIGPFLDDFAAILYALKSKEIELRAITSVYGNPELGAKLAKKLVDYSGEKIDVYIGETNPLEGEAYRTRVVTRGILSDDEIKCNAEEMGIKRNAVDFLVREIIDNKGKYDLITIGALTNIALALRKNPEIAGNINHHYIMGGSIRYNPDFPEYNITCDPEAAEIVFNSKTAKTLVPLDATMQAKIRQEDFSKLAKLGKLERAVLSAADFCFRSEQEIDTAMHDPLTLVIATNPEIAETEEMSLEVNFEGFTFPSTRSREESPISVCTGFNYNAFKDIFLRTILG